MVVVLKDLNAIYGAKDGQALVIGGHAISASLGKGSRETYVPSFAA